MAIRILIFLVLVTAGTVLPDRSCADTRLGILPVPEAAHIRLSDQGPALVQEYHHLSLGKGITQVTFSWPGVRLDPDAVLLTPLEDPESIRVMSTVFPPDSNHLIWEVDCQKTGVVPVIISYLPAGLDSLVTYTATLSADETDLDLDTRLVLRNFSGQTYSLATVRLDADTMFSTQILDRETRQIPFPVSQNPAVKKIFHWDGQSMPHDPKNQNAYPGVPFGYRLTLPADDFDNTADLRAGKVRIFLKDAQNRTLFTGEDTLPFLAKGDTFFLETGRSRDIVITKRRMNTDKKRIRRNDKGKIQVFDQVVTDRFILENTSDTPAEIRLIERISGEWEPVDMGHGYTLEDHETLIFDIFLDAEETRSFDLTYEMLNLFADKFIQFNKVSQQ
ncbi:MAG: hypothetical protein ACQEQ5_00730 [Thermodesulfobacteriota bacterium]